MKFIYLIFINRYFCANKNGNILSFQKGVFRMNCVDCLDRTNVVQGLLARRIILIQLIVRMIQLIDEFKITDYNDT